MMALGIVAVGGYLLLTDQMGGIIDRVKEALDNIGGTVKERLPPVPTPGGGAVGGPISQGGGCPSGQNCGPCRSQSGGTRCECNGVKAAAYEATFCGTWSGDDMSIKMWGPTHHSGSDCCWCILSVSPDGQFGIRHEGPHPDTGSKSGSTSIGGKPSCIKGVISPGPKGAHVEGWGLVGGTWKKAFTYDGPCGLNKKSTKPHANQQVSFRCDGSLSAKCATVRPLSSAAAAYLTPLPRITIA
jgi:hypothetical protein